MLRGNQPIHDLIGLFLVDAEQMDWIIPNPEHHKPATSVVPQSWLMEIGRFAGAERLQVAEVDLDAYMGRIAAVAKSTPPAKAREDRMLARFAQIVSRSE